MHIGFIEDTHLHGGTQIWVVEAIHNFLRKDHEVSLLAPKNSWVVDKCLKTSAHICTYDWDEVVDHNLPSQMIWTDCLQHCSVAICTVHPPRHGFHCSVFAAKCIKDGGLNTHLIPKTGTIVPEYLREFYLPDETIHAPVIAITDFTRKYLIEKYRIPADKVSLIYQGTDTERFKSSEKNEKEARKRYPIDETASPVIGSIGSFEERKGHPVLFDAVQELVRGDLPHTQLMMVGDGPDEIMLKERVKAMGLKDHVIFYPFTNEPEYIYEQLDMTILPSLFKEGLPNVLLESMSMGIPVVASDIGGVSEIVINDETGFMVEPGDKSALADSIQKIWKNPENYQRMKDNARKLITSHFNKEIQFDRFLSHFQAIDLPK
jgi:glycosyltransferase involved in cell wall biosynthesis